MSRWFPPEDEWWHKGLHFECQKSGNCCTSHGEFGYVYVTLKDRTALAEHFQLSLEEFTQKYCEKTDGIYHLIERPGNPDCLFLKEKKCDAYAARPMQCRTWPFWPANMNAKTWNKEIATFCAGIGKGPLVSKKEIAATLKIQEKSDSELGT